MFSSEYCVFTFPIPTAGPVVFEIKPIITNLVGLRIHDITTDLDFVRSIAGQGAGVGVIRSSELGNLTTDGFRINGESRPGVVGFFSAASLINDTYPTHKHKPFYFEGRNITTVTLDITWLDGSPLFLNGATAIFITLELIKNKYS